MFCSTEIINTQVFPIPDRAWQRMSSFIRAFGMHWLCTTPVRKGRTPSTLRRMLEAAFRNRLHDLVLQEEGLKARSTDSRVVSPESDAYRQCTNFSAVSWGSGSAVAVT